MSPSFPPWTDEHNMIRRTVRQFAEERLAPHRFEWDKQGEWPAREIFKEMADLGLLGIKVEPEYDGMGLDWWANTAFVEALSWGRNAGVIMSILVNTDMATGVIHEIGTHEQKEEFLAPVVRGEKIAAQDMENALKSFVSASGADEFAKKMRQKIGRDIRDLAAMTQ